MTLNLPVIYFQLGWSNAQSLHICTFTKLKQMKVNNIDCIPIMSHSPQNYWGFFGIHVNVSWSSSRIAAALVRLRLPEVCWVLSFRLRDSLTWPGRERSSGFLGVLIELELGGVRERQQSDISIRTQDPACYEQVYVCAMDTHYTHRTFGI